MVDQRSTVFEKGNCLVRAMSPLVVACHRKSPDVISGAHTANGWLISAISAYTFEAIKAVGNHLGNMDFAESPDCRPAEASPGAVPSAARPLGPEAPDASVRPPERDGAATFDWPHRGPGRPKGLPRPPGSGRQKGTPNRVTAEVKSLAQRYGRRAIRELAKLALKSPDEQVRLAALRELLNRGYGKPVQPTELSGPDRGPVPLVDVAALNPLEQARRLAFLLRQAAQAQVEPSPPAEPPRQLPTRTGGPGCGVAQPEAPRVASTGELLPARVREIEPGVFDVAS